jgi:hypothetical protein
MVNRMGLKRLGLIAIAAWIAVWTFIFWMNLHRADVGDLGAWAWIHKADAPLPAARRAFALASAQYEYDVAERARPWVRKAGLALSGAGFLAVILTAAALRPRPIGAAAMGPKERSAPATPSNDQDSPIRRFWDRKAS